MDLSVNGLNMHDQGGNRWCTPDDAEGNQECLDIDGDFMIPVEVEPQIILGTSLTLDATALGVLPLSIDTNPVMLRVRPAAEPLHGYVVNLKGKNSAYFLIKLPAYLDAPDLQVLGGLAGHDANSIPIEPYLIGPISFQDDSRIALRVSNLNTIEVTLNVNVLNLGVLEAGNATLRLNKDQVFLRVVNHPSRARKIPEQAK